MNPMFERDLLYPTGDPTQPASVHIVVYPPKNNGLMPVLVEAKTSHTHVEYLDTIVTIMQTDVFDRIRMDLRKVGELYFKDQPADSTYVRIYYVEGKPVFESGVQLELV